MSFILLVRECSPRDSNAHARDGARRLELRVSSCCTRRAISADGGTRTRMPFRASLLSAVCMAFHHVDGVLRRGVEPPRSRDHCGLNAARFPFRHLSMKCCGPDSSRQFLGLKPSAFSNFATAAECETWGSNPADRACRARGFTSNLVSRSSLLRRAPHSAEPVRLPSTDGGATESRTRPARLSGVQGHDRTV